MRQLARVNASTDNDNLDWRTRSSQIFEHLTKLDEQESLLLGKIEELTTRRSEIRQNLTRWMRELTYEDGL